VKVRVMLIPARRGGESENEEARKLMTDAGVDVRDSSPDFALAHQKSMVVDGEVRFVGSLKREPGDLTLKRDYAVVTTKAHEVAEMCACFDADWERKPFEPAASSKLIWCPNNGRRRMAEFIDRTKHFLWLQNERYQDQVIIERLVRAVRRGVKVNVLAKAPHSLKPDKLVEGVVGLRILQDVGAKVHTLKHLKLHAKILLADDKRAVVGSINIAPGSFDDRRELAIETDDTGAVKRLKQTVEHDWSKSHHLDLSDAALLADLEKRKGLDPEELVLYEDSEHWGYHHNGHHGKHPGSKHSSGPPRRCRRHRPVACLGHARPSSTDASIAQGARQLSWREQWDCPVHARVLFSF
jgi:phosphatidylserine/phosphatidylglycerophosphate/cardiolipin synthase-like enzyme